MLRQPFLVMWLSLMIIAKASMIRPWMGDRNTLQVHEVATGSGVELCGELMLCYRSMGLSKDDGGCRQVKRH